VEDFERLLELRRFLKASVGNVCRKCSLEAFGGERWMEMRVVKLDLTVCSRRLVQMYDPSVMICVVGAF